MLLTQVMLVSGNSRKDLQEEINKAMINIINVTGEVVSFGDIEIIPGTREGFSNNRGLEYGGSAIIKYSVEYQPKGEDGYKIPNNRIGLGIWKKEEPTFKVSIS